SPAERANCGESMIVCTQMTAKQPSPRAASSIWLRGGRCGSAGRGSDPSLLAIGSGATASSGIFVFLRDQPTCPAMFSQRHRQHCAGDERDGDHENIQPGCRWDVKRFESPMKAENEQRVHQ